MCLCPMSLLVQFALFIKFSVQRLAAGKELYSFAGAQKTGGAAAGSLDMGVIEASYPVQRGLRCLQGFLEG